MLYSNFGNTESPRPTQQKRCSSYLGYIESLSDVWMHFHYILHPTVPNNQVVKVTCCLLLVGAEEHMNSALPNM